MGQIIESPFQDESYRKQNQGTEYSDENLSPDEERFAKKFSRRWPPEKDTRNIGVYSLTCLLLDSEWEPIKIGRLIQTIAEYAGDPMAKTVPILVQMYSETVNSMQYIHAIRQINTIFGSTALDVFCNDFDVGDPEEKWVQDQIYDFNKKHARVWLSSKQYILRETYDLDQVL